MMKRVYLLSALVILLHLSGNLSAQKEFSFKQITEKEFLRAKKHQQYHDYTIDTTVNVSVSDTLIIFPLDNGKTRELKLSYDNLQLYRELKTLSLLDSSLGVDEYPSLEYLGFCKQLNAYMAREIDIPTSNVYLVRKDNGSAQQILDYLIYNDKYIISWDVPECDHYEGIKVFGIANNYFYPILSFHSESMVESKKKKSYEDYYKMPYNDKLRKFEWITDWTDIFFDSDNSFVFKIYDSEYKNGKWIDRTVYYRCVIKE
ncbi:MAG: hypothetical protein IJ681_07795 [Bacteroidales bacterium]|nr:hypothetical protein [Bacteroidales bacterium]